MNSIKLVEVVPQRNLTNEGTSERRQAYTLREVFVNPEHVVCMRPDESMRQKLADSMLPDDMDSRQEFTKIYINRGQTGLDITVVGSPAMVEKKIREKQNKIRKQLLRGNT